MADKLKTCQKCGKIGYSIRKGLCLVCLELGDADDIVEKRER